MSRKRKKGLVARIILLGLLAAAALYVYLKFFPAVQLKDRAYVYLYIHRNDSFSDVADRVEDEGLISDRQAFEWLAKRMELEENIHAGRYRILNGMTMRQIINLIRYNRQEKVKLSYNTQIRDMDDFISYTDEKLELEEDELLDFLEDENNFDPKMGLDPDNRFALVVPGVYEVSWAIGAEELFALLNDRFTGIWTPARVAKARRMGLSVAEVITLASIVQSESGISGEQRKIAGVYMNRLRKQMPLQADPTLKFANRVYDARRVLDADKLTASPYNTYRFRGLPPGPICLVNTQAIDATLNYEKHNYFYFCAKPELNGYSAYSSSYEQHQRNAAEYRRALDRMGISR